MRDLRQGGGRGCASLAEISSHTAAPAKHAQVVRLAFGLNSTLLCGRIHSAPHRPTCSFLAAAAAAAASFLAAYISHAMGSRETSTMPSTTRLKFSCTAGTLPKAKPAPVERAEGQRERVRLPC